MESLLTDSAPVLRLQPGRMMGLEGPAGSGLTRLGLCLLSEPARRGRVAFLDVRGWFCPVAAWEAGIPPDRLVVVRCPERGDWPRVVAALLKGVRALYAEVPEGMGETALRRLAALARAGGSAAALRPLRGNLPAGVAHLRLRAEAVRWDGPDRGHGRLRSRSLLVRLSGKAVAGMDPVVEVEDDGADAVRVVSRLALATGGRAAG